MALLIGPRLTFLPSFNQMVVVVINIAVFTLVVAVLGHNKLKNKLSKIFLAMSAFMLIWVDFAYSARIVGRNNSLSEIFLRIAWIATPILFYLTYLVSIYLLNKGRRYSYLNKIFFLLSIILSSITAFTNLIIKGIRLVGNDLDIVYGIGFYPFLVVIFIFMLATLVPLFKTKTNQSVKLFLMGVLVFYTANLIFNIALPVMFNLTHLYYIGDYSTIFLLGLTAYAIIEHKLFDIKVLATKALTMILWIILLSKVLSATSYSDFIVDFLVLITVLLFGYFLIKSVSREVEQREKLERLTEKLKALDKQKDEFISMAAHELRAPMTAIKGYISMIMDGDAGEIPGKVRDYLTDANSVNDRLVRLVNNMLNVSRIEEGRMVYSKAVVNLSEVARAAYVSFKFEAERKGLGFLFEPLKNGNDKVEVDSDRLHEVVGNFVSNAVKYTEKGFIKIRVVQPNPHTARLEVVDSGPGISKTEQKKLFQKFYRVESTVGKTIGTGLGLYISKLLIGKFGGKIGIDSEVGKGSTFWFELPTVGAEAKTKSEA